MGLEEFTYKVQSACQQYLPQRTLNIYPEGKGKPGGRVLVSYLPLPLFGDPAEFRGHSNVWESSEIVGIFNRLGYSVDLIAWNDSSFMPESGYDLVFDIHRNLVRCSGDDTQAIFHITGSNPEFSNRAEALRLDELRARRGAVVAARRAVGDDDMRLFSENLARADLVTLIGNNVTAATFPDSVQAKLRRVVATGARLPSTLESTPVCSRPQEFLWFNGKGAVLKGLDLVLEVFAGHQELILHVVGPYLRERDFVAVYRTELFAMPNIRNHGFLLPASRKFQEIAARVRAFVSPSCSEGISTAAITCMQAGIVPIISRNCGITLPDHSGILLDDCSISTIESAVQSIVCMNDDSWHSMAENTRQFALETYSRALFSRQMEEAVASLLPGS